jgi:exodeoxyribonuclease VII small subunit
MAKAEPTFEQAIEQLEAIVERIESGEVGLEEAIKQYEQGAALIKRCRSILGAAEKKIAELKVEDVPEEPAEDAEPAGDPADDEAPF